MTTPLSDHSTYVYSSSLEKEIREDEQRLKVKDGVMKEYQQKSDEKVCRGVCRVERKEMIFSPLTGKADGALEGATGHI